MKKQRKAARKAWAKRMKWSCGVNYHLMLDRPILSAWEGNFFIIPRKYYK